MVDLRSVIDYGTFIERLCSPDLGVSRVTFYPNKYETECLAAKMTNDDESGWTYKAEPRGKYVVLAVYDEENELLGYL